MAFLSQSLFSRLCFNILCIAVLLCSFEARSNADDEYLKMLDGEAEDVKLDQSSQIKNKKQIKAVSTDSITKTDWKWDGDLEGDVLPKGLAHDEFAALLKQHFYGTFVFYRKLTSVDQENVYYHYTKSSSANLDSIRENILNYLKSR